MFGFITKEELKQAVKDLQEDIWDILNKLSNIETCADCGCMVKNENAYSYRHGTRVSVDCEDAEYHEKYYCYSCGLKDLVLMGCRP